MLRSAVLLGALLVPFAALADEQANEQRIENLEKRNRELEERLRQLEEARRTGDQARIDELERKNKELEERLQRVEQQDELLAEEIDSFLAGREDEEGLGLNMVIRKGDVTGIVQLFGSGGVRFDNPELTGRSNTFFFNGTFDLFFTARAGDHFHALSETVFLTSLGEPKDSSDFDQERLWGAWRFNDLVQVKLGLEHGPISRWNSLYHHGQFLELTVTRPFLARFEGAGGILPMHNAGIELSGSLRTKHGTFNYFVVVSNGRGRVVTDTQEFSDRNDNKAVDAGVGFRPEGLSELWIGIFVRFDKMAPNPIDPARLASIREFIASLQVDYRGERVEILMEVIYLENRDEQSRQNFEHVSGYLQVAYHLNDEWTPYVRIDIRQMEAGDPYFMPLDRDLDIWELLFGVRFDFVNNAALKLEVGFGEADERNSAGIVSKGSYIRIGFQLAWVF